MEYKNIVDVHTHSIHSFDGNDSVESLCLSAIEKGSKVIAITDHCDIDGAEMNPDELCPPQLKDLNECISKYSDKIKILKILFECKKIKLLILSPKIGRASCRERV